MRWFIVFLLTANVMLFFWVQHQSRQEPGSTALPAPDVGRLRLLNEHPEGGAKPDTVQNPSTVAEAETETPLSTAVQVEAGAAVSDTPDPGTRESAVELSSAEDDRIAAGTSPATGAQPAPVPDENPKVVAGDAAVPMDATVTETDESSEQPADGPPAGQEPSAAGVAVAAPPAETVQAERDETPLPAPGSRDGETTGSGWAEPSTPICARVGPLGAARADRLLADLPDGLELLSDTTAEYTVAETYFVMIPPLASRAEARQKIEELADAGIEDTWLFPSGEFRNAISLGLFKRENGALRHVENIKRRGFDAVVKERGPRRQGRWLMLKSTRGGDIGSRLDLTGDVKVESRGCP